MVKAIVDWLWETNKWLFARGAVQTGKSELARAARRYIHPFNRQDQNIPARAFGFDVILHVAIDT